MKLLEKYIKRVLKENISLNDTVGLVKMLNDKSKECIEFFEKEDRLSAIPYNSYRYILEVIEEINIDRIGSGESREAYSFENVDWVLKVAVNNFGAKVLKQEIEISQMSKELSDHGSGAQDMFVEVYHYDEINDKPIWMICEKVEILHDFEDMESLVKIFPTFWNAIREEYKSKVKLYAFKDLISGTLYDMINSKFDSSKKKKKAFKDWQDLEGESARVYRDAMMFSRSTNKSIHKDLIRKANRKAQGAKEYIIRPNASKVAFHEALISSIPNEDMIKDIADINFGEDFKRICRAFAYIKTEDLHDENIGIRSSSNPNPTDFVIIDFMM
jgi:hypothetical protein